MIYKDMIKLADAVAPIFEVMHWEWGNKVPDRDAIVSTLESLESDLVSNENMVAMSTGRLFAERLRDTREIVFGLQQDSYEEYGDAIEMGLYDSQ